MKYKVPDPLAGSVKLKFEPDAHALRAFPLDKFAAATRLSMITLGSLIPSPKAIAEPNHQQQRNRTHLRDFHRHHPVRQRIRLGALSPKPWGSVREVSLFDIQGQAEISIFPQEI